MTKITSNPSLIDLVKRKRWDDVLLRSKHANWKEYLETDPTHFNQTSLHIAVKLKAPMDVIRCLVSSQTASQKESHTGYLPLHYAIRYKSSLQIIHLLADAYKEGVVMRVDNDNLTSLHLACYFNAHLSVIHLLLMTNPTVVKMKTKQNATALHIACRNPKSSSKTIKCLLQSYPEAAQLTMAGAWSPLHLAILHDASHEILVELVTACPEMIYSKTSSSGQTPLGLYCWGKNNDVISSNIVSLLLAPINHHHHQRSSEGLVHRALKFPQPIPNLLEYILDEFPQHSKYHDGEERLPLHVAIEMKDKVEDGAWKKIFKCYPDAIYEHGNSCCFRYPIIIASLQSDLDLTFELISLAPGILEDIRRRKEN